MCPTLNKFSAALFGGLFLREECDSRDTSTLE